MISEIFQRIDINLIAIIVLGFVLFLAIKRLDHKTTMNRVFILVCILDITELVLETLTCLINSVPGKGIYVLSNVAHVILFSLAPVLGLHWFYLTRNIFQPYKRIGKIANMFLALPLIVNFVMVVLSPIYHFAFSIDENNTYSRGGVWFYVTGGITYAYIVSATISTLFSRGKTLKGEYSMILTIFLLPVIGGIVQGLIYGTLLIWACAAFSLVIVFIFLQQRMVHLDSLTGCWTRDSLLYFISIRLNQKKGRFGAIYFDINKLKYINDNFGHLEGDHAITNAVALVRSVLGPNDIIARMGGDEFVVILDKASDGIIADVMRKVKEKFVEFNRGEGRKYVLECSFGADTYAPSYVNFEQFLNHVDTLMYKQKDR